MTMIEQHELAFAILRWIGILTLPAFYAGLFIAIFLADRKEAEIRRAAASVDTLPKGPAQPENEEGMRG